MKVKSLRAIPAVEKVLQALGQTDLPRATVVALVRRKLAALRKASAIPSFDEVLGQTRLAIKDVERSRIQPVINGTGIIVHTNLGRAPLGAQVVETLASIGAALVAGDQNR